MHFDQATKENFKLWLQMSLCVLMTEKEKEKRVNITLYVIK